jgi:hypothetical protein
MIHQSPNIKNHLYSLIHVINYFYDLTIAKEKTPQNKIDFLHKIYNIHLGKNKNLKNLMG